MERWRVAPEVSPERRESHVGFCYSVYFSDLAFSSRCLPGVFTGVRQARRRNLRMYEPAYQQFLLIVIPVILIACYLAFHRERKNLAVLIVSILLVVLGIPHLFTIPAILSGGIFVGTDSFIFLLF